MKFQDDISNMNTYIHTYVRTYIHTYIHTDKPKPICPLLFQSWGHNKSILSVSVCFFYHGVFSLLSLLPYTVTPNACKVTARIV